MDYAQWPNTIICHSLRSTMIKRPIVLLSKSPRRSQLLKESGFNFTVEIKDIDESYPAELPKEEVAEFIARKKADAGHEFLTDENLVLTADTIVLLDNKIYEKPTDKADAVRILQELSGKTHKVITGVALLTQSGVTSFSEHSLVTFDQLSAEEIEYYLETWAPYDKAGSYGIQEWIGHCKIVKMEGSYTNIMGLPMHGVYQHVNKA